MRLKSCEINVNFELNGVYHHTVTKLHNISMRKDLAELITQKTENKLQLEDFDIVLIAKNIRDDEANCLGQGRDEIPSDLGNILFKLSTISSTDCYFLQFTCPSQSLTSNFKDLRVIVSERLNVKLVENCSSCLS